ncbi:hypothetical protein [Azorhizobium sp. AG788]|uniref:hypothetical protein n=1 Tax=Azorhizobium sp. AG788 TaxID=2183897 RepID=UPI0031389028
MTSRPQRPSRRGRARALAVPAVAIRFLLAFGLLLALAALLAGIGTARAAERGVTFAPPSSGGSSGGYGGYGGGNWNGGGNNGGGNWNGGGGAPVVVAPFVNVPLSPDQTPMPQGAPMIPANQIQAIVSSAGYAQVQKPQFSQGFYYVQATSAAGPVLLAVDAYSGQVVSSRPVATTPRPPVVESGSLIGSGSQIGTPPPTRPRGPLAPDPNNPDGE